jgi:branched-subunit amino acid transport protein
VGGMADKCWNWHIRWYPITCELALEFTIPLNFLALAVPTIKDRFTFAVAVFAGLMAVLAFGAPYNTGLSDCIPGRNFCGNVLRMGGCMTVWLIMIALALGTFLIRISFIILLSNRGVPPLIVRALRFVPASVLSALVIPQFIIHNNSLNLSLGNPRLIAGIIAAVIAWRTKNVLLTILSGMVVLWVLQVLIPGV